MVRLLPSNQACVIILYNAEYELNRYQALQRTVRQCYAATGSMLTSMVYVNVVMKGLYIKFSC